ncbi:MAG: hypothetical protein LBD48_15095 [Treponema sp.]|jgi:hypothetical protein|nr:hypothetical protein [Treponema sp.]
MKTAGPGRPELHFKRSENETPANFRGTRLKNSLKGGRDQRVPQNGQDYRANHGKAATGDKSQQTTEIYTHMSTKSIISPFDTL